MKQVQKSILSKEKNQPAPVSTLWVCGWVTLRGTWSINCTCSLPLLPTASHNKYKDSPFKISVFCTLQNPGSDLEGLDCSVRGRVGRDCRAVMSDSVRVRLQQRNELTAARVQSFQGTQGGKGLPRKESAEISSNIWNGMYWELGYILCTTYAEGYWPCFFESPPLQV